MTEQGMSRNRTVVIDCFPSSVQHYREGYVIVAVDVIRATTSMVTASAMGRQCFVAPTLVAAWQLTTKLKNPLLVGELRGRMPEGFDMNNSPAELAQRTDISRPMIILSSTGSQLVYEAGKCDIAYLACLRNGASLSSYLAGRHPRIALIGAGSLGEFREEDQMCCAWIARDLMKAGYAPQDGRTVELVKHWSSAAPDAFVGGKSVEFLRRSGQLKDLDFILSHINDVNDIFRIRNDEVVRLASEPQSVEPHRTSY